MNPRGRTRNLGCFFLPWWCFVQLRF